LCEMQRRQSARQTSLRGVWLCARTPNATSSAKEPHPSPLGIREATDPEKL